MNYYPVATRKRTSIVWNYFKIISSVRCISECLICHNRFSHRSSVSNLKKHLVKIHGIDLNNSLFPKQERQETNEKDSCDDEDPEAVNTLLGLSGAHVEAVEVVEAMDDGNIIIPEENNIDDVPRVVRKDASKVWDYFKKQDSYMATCNLCHKRFSYRCSSNLKKHLYARHPLVKLPFPDSTRWERQENNSCDDDDIDPEVTNTLVELSGAHVDKTMKIIEAMDDENYIVYNSDDNDDLRVKKVARPVLKKCLNEVQAKSKEEITSEPVPDVKKKTEDYIDILIKSIESKLRKMSETQQVIAEYKIHEILFLGLCNHLKFPSVLDGSSEHMNYTIEVVNNDSHNEV